MKRLLPGTISAAITLLLSVGTAMSSSLPSENLILNPGAEDGVGVPPTSQTDTGPIPSWSRTIGSFTAVKYGAPGPLAGDGGNNYFAGGAGAERSEAEQTVSALSFWGPQIDAFGVEALVEADLGGWESQEDLAVIDPIFYNAKGHALEAAFSGPSAAERGGQTGLIHKMRWVVLPPGTRSAVVTMQALRFAGDYNDGYLDNVSLRLFSAPAPPKTELDLFEDFITNLMFVAVRPSSGAKVRKVMFIEDRKRRVDRSAPFSTKFPISAHPKPCTVKAAVTLRSGKKQTLTKRAKC